MKNYKDMGNNQIMVEIVSLQAEHEAIKVRILQEMDNLELIEKKFNEANKTLVARIKGQRDE